jgi:hypothetical protein
MIVRSLALALALTGCASFPALAQTPTPPESSTPPAGPPRAAREAMRKACAVDIKTYCSDLQPDQTLRQCIRDNYPKLSPDCQTALKQMRAQRQPQG